MTGCQAQASSKVSGVSMPGRPAWCESSQRTGICSLPAAPNSGQYSTTGASRSSSPRWTSRWAQIAVAPFVVDATSDDGVLAPRPVRLAIGESAPQVDDRAAAYVDAARRADLAGVPFEVRTEGIGDLPPTLLDVSLH